MTKRKRTGLVLGLLALVLLAAAAVLLLPRVLRPAAPGSEFETVPVERGTVAETIGQTGTVLSRQSTVLMWRTSGKVAEVLVQVGDTVQAGQTLIRLDPTSLPEQVLQAHLDLMDAQRALAELLQSQKARADAAANLVKAQKAVEDAQSDQRLLDQPNASPANIEGAQAGVDLAQANLNRAEQIYSLFENRPEDDVQRLQAAAQLERARRQLTTAQINLQYATSKPGTITAAQVNSQVAVAEAALQDAQREWERVKNGPNPDDLAAAQARIEAAQAAIALGEIKAPIAGTVTQVFPKVGDLVDEKKAAARVDDLTELSIEVGVPEIDINRVKTGQIASVTFDAIRNKTYLGRVTMVEDVGAPHQGIIDFPVHINLVDEDRTVKPGMTAAVSIIVSQVEDVLLVPNRAVRHYEGQTVIFVLRDRRQVRLPVQLGIGSDLQTQVISADLREGDLIILNPVSTTPEP